VRYSQYVDNGRVRIDSEGRRLLQCHSRGAKEYSPFFCPVVSFGQLRSIEDHYQSTKVFLSADQQLLKAQDWRQAKERQRAGLELLYFELPNGVTLGTSNRSMDDLVIQYYISLWYRFLGAHPELITHAQGYDGYEDIFEGSFPFSQARVMEQVVTQGLASLVPLFEPLRLLLRQAA
jgi:hypothetical protein